MNEKKSKPYVPRPEPMNLPTEPRGVGSSGSGFWWSLAAFALVVVGVLVLAALLSGCAPPPLRIAATSSQVDPETVRSVPPPAWALDPVGQWLNMDWDLWSCPRAQRCQPVTN